MNVVTATKGTDMQDTMLSAGDIRDLLVEASMPPSAKRWPEPGFAIIEGRVYAPHAESGVLLVDGKPEFSAAWR